MIFATTPEDSDTPVDRLTLDNAGSAIIDELTIYHNSHFEAAGMAPRCTPTAFTMKNTPTSLLHKCNAQMIWSLMLPTTWKPA